jgi:hypothetical protein
MSVPGSIAMLEYLHVLTFFSWIPLALLASTQNDQRPTARFLWALCGVTFLLCGYILYFESFFGKIDKKDDPRVGHCHFWLMFKCEAKVECVYSQADLGETPLPGTFKAESVSGPPRDVVVSGWSQDRFTLTLSPRGSDTFVRSPVSYSEMVSAPGKVTFHGSFSQTRIDRDYIYLVQMWLWQSGDRWVAYYARQNAMCGSTNDFIHASAYEGKPRLGQIYFTGATGDQKIEEFHVQAPALTSGQIDGQIIYNGRPLETITLKRSSILRSPIYESAPLTDFEVTTDWLKTVSMGYFMSWKAECLGSQGSVPTVPPRGSFVNIGQAQ